MKTETMNLIIGILIGIIIASLGFTIYYGSISNNPQIPGNMQMSGDRMEPPDRPSGEGMPGGPSQGNGGPGENIPGGSNGGMGGNQNVSVNYSAVKEIKSDEEISNTTISSKIKLTGDCYVTSFENADNTNSNIDFNGYKLYVNRKAI